MNRRIPALAALAVIIGLVFAFGCWVYFGDTYVRQARRMRQVREYLPSLTNIVFSHPEFRDVRISSGFGSGGCILVYGFVENQKQVSELGKAVAAAKPPFPVEYQLQILGESGVYKP